MLNYVYIRYADVIGRRAHPATLKKALGELKLSSALFALSRMNVLLGRQRMMREGATERRRLQNILVANYIDDELWRGIERTIVKFRTAADGPVEFAVFTRQQMLNLLRLGILVGREDSSLTVDGKTSGAYQLGRCCLMMNDHLLTPKEERAISEGGVQKRTTHISLQLAPILELYNPPDVQRAAVRAETIFSDLLRDPRMQATAKQQLQGFDLAHAFLDATGITLDRYREIVLALLTPILGHTSEELLDDRNLTLFRRAAFIRNSTLQPQEFDNYLALDCISARDAKTRFKSKQAKVLPHFNYVLFRSKPFLELENGTILWSDPCFLVEKLGAGIYWTIVDSLTGSNKDTALIAFGYLFEMYVNSILERLPSKNGTVLSSPKYTNSDSSVDGLIYRDTNLILAEYKASFMTIEAKYGGRVKQFERELDKKFATQKGLVQLAKHIERLFHEDPSKRSHVDDLDRLTRSSGQPVEQITPVLIVQESILRFSGVENLLNRRFQRLMKKRRVAKGLEISQLAIVDIDTLEEMKPNLLAGDFTLEECVKARAAADPDYKQIWHEFMHDNFHSYSTRRDSELERKFETIIERTKRNLFGTESNGQTTDQS